MRPIFIKVWLYMICCVCALKKKQFQQFFIYFFFLRENVWRKMLYRWILQFFSHDLYLVSLWLCVHNNLLPRFSVSIHYRNINCTIEFAGRKAPRHVNTHKPPIFAKYCQILCVCIGNVSSNNMCVTGVLVLYTVIHIYKLNIHNNKYV